VELVVEKTPKVVNKLPVVKVYSFDFDGCLFNQRYLDYLSDPKAWYARHNDGKPLPAHIDPFIYFNEKMIQSIVDEIVSGGFASVYFIVGSNRQDQASDQINFYRGGSCFPAIIKLVEEVNRRLEEAKSTVVVQLDRTLMADMYEQENKKKIIPGDSFNLALEELNRENENKKKGEYSVVPSLAHRMPWSDTTKIPLNRTQIHRIASNHPDSAIILNFRDDDNVILNGLGDFFGKDRRLVPYNGTLELDHYAGEEVERVVTIEGEGFIDYNYRGTLNDVLCDMAGSRQAESFEVNRLINLDVEEFITRCQAGLDGGKDKQRYANAQLRWAKGYIAQEGARIEAEAEQNLNLSKGDKGVFNRFQTFLKHDTKLSSELIAQIWVDTAMTLRKLSNAKSIGEKLRIVESYQTGNTKDAVVNVRDLLYLHVCIENVLKTGQKTLDENSTSQKSPFKAYYAQNISYWSDSVFRTLLEGTNENGEELPEQKLSEPLCSSIKRLVTALDIDIIKQNGSTSEEKNASTAGKLYIDTAVMLVKFKKAKTEQEKFKHIQDYVEMCKALPVSAWKRFGVLIGSLVLALLVSALVFSLSSYFFSLHHGVDFIKEIVSGWQDLIQKDFAGAAGFLVSASLAAFCGGRSIFAGGGYVAWAAKSRYSGEIDALDKASKLIAPSAGGSVGNAVIREEDVLNSKSAPLPYADISKLNI
jgi:hypothetical protein